MSRPPERSWMVATLIGSSPQALEPNMPAAAIAAVLCKNLLRLTFIAVLLLVVGADADETRYFLNRRTHPRCGRRMLGPAWDLASAVEIYSASLVQLAISQGLRYRSHNIAPIVNTIAFFSVCFLD